jgi:predicted GTPase
MRKINIIIMGAAGRDFHNFNMYFRDNPLYNVVAFTATQIPNIANRVYPPSLAGELYPNGIPIYPDNKLEELIEHYKVDQVILAYHDVSYNHVMHASARVMAAGADFRLMGYKNTQIQLQKPAISVCAVRTGCGKSQTVRAIAEILKDMGLKIGIVRHPMPYGDLEAQISMKFSSIEDLERYNCTIEEREEFESSILQNITVYAGVDYQKIIAEAEKEVDIIIWDGGNNDFPFIATDIHIVVVDPHRPGHEISYFPSEVNVKLADIIIINKVNTADPKDIAVVKNNVKLLNSTAIILEADSVVSCDNPSLIKGKSVLVIEDGPTLTHGGMPYGAATVCAKANNCKKIVDPQPYAVGSIKTMYKENLHLKNVLPAVGYSKDQLKDLEETINATPCDLVLVGTPTELHRFMNLNKPCMYVRYKLKLRDNADLKALLMDKFKAKDIQL